VHGDAKRWRGWVLTPPYPDRWPEALHLPCGQEIDAMERCVDGGQVPLAEVLDWLAIHEGQCPVRP
jgi:hypothetical protein